MKWWGRNCDAYEVTFGIEGDLEVAHEVQRLFTKALADAGIVGQQVAFRGGWIDMPKCDCGHDEIRHYTFLIGVLDEPVGVESTCEFCDCQTFTQRSVVR